MTDQPRQPVEGERPMSEREQVSDDFKQRVDRIIEGNREVLVELGRDEQADPAWQYANELEAQLQEVLTALQSQRKLTEEAQAALDYESKALDTERDAKVAAERQVDEYREGLEDQLRRKRRAQRLWDKQFDRVQELEAGLQEIADNLAAPFKRGEVNASPACVGKAVEVARSLLAPETKSPESNDG